MTGTPDKVVELGVHESMTPEQTLEMAKRKGWSKLVVIGFDDTPEGKLQMVCSDISVADATMLCRCAEIKMMKWMFE